MSPRRSRLSPLVTNVLVALPLLGGAAVFAWTRFFPEQFRAVTTSNLVAVEEGAFVPVAEVKDASGEVVSLPSLVGEQGAAVVVVDPASPRSRDELVALSRVLASGPAVPVLVVSVGDPAETPGLRAAHPRLAVYDDATGGFASRYGLRGTPVLLLAGGDRRVRAVHGGLLTGAELRRILRPTDGS